MDLLISMSQINLPANGKRKFMSSLHISQVDKDNKCYHWSPFPFELNGASLIVPSPSGTKLLIVRNSDTGAKEKSSSVKFEIWGQAQLLKEIWIPSSVHGPLYTDGWFESVSWSKDEDLIAYIAEESAVSLPTFGRQPSDDPKSKSASDNELGTWKGQGEWVEDWGESYSGKRKPKILVANISSGVVQGVEGIPTDLSPGQVIWAPPAEGEKLQMLIFVGWTSYASNFTTPRRLGMIYCYNRPCAIYAVEAPQFERKWPKSKSLPLAIKLTDGVSSALLPRFSPDGKILAFLSAKAAVDSGLHNATNSLYCLSWSPQADLASKLQAKEVVPVCLSSRGGFPGIYCGHLISNPWLSDNCTLVFSSIWRSTQVILATNIESGKVFRITPPDSAASWSLLSVQKDLIFAVVSSPVSPPTLMIGHPPNDGSADDFEKLWSWFDVSVPFTKHPDKVDSTLVSRKFEILQVPILCSANRESPSKGSDEPFEAIFVFSPIGNGTHTNEGREKIKQSPLLLVLHGGPHSVSLTNFSRTNAFLLASGFNLLHVNYRGSIGFGEQALQSLAGNVGRQDVEDILTALDLVIGKGYADPNRVAVFGGSHGGFLTSHLIGQAPDRFITGVLRNPVCNLSSMVGVTDIPDWCFVEAYGKDALSTYSEIPSEKDLSVFYQASPIAHAHKVKVPTLFLLGAQDRRVPISNGFQYVQALRARGLEVKVVVFPDDCHPIDRPQSEFETFVNIGTWLKRFF
ncbi:hypothetical protein O6H91_01G075800 [Diphasiastrum complanatum]|nr:hypothetical protein O6H91_01G075800 [Diphasiastrum complanatum]KAJ7569388.1 hypothetical protein O6H91_01G075800 [Diphasiastrum complanatum]KAJ7569390.1 hypothetical protein O6H91_01G075800 [Diphasiastrum complanatum]